MAYGLQVFDSSSTLILNSPKRLSRLLQTISVVLQPNSTVDIPVTGLADDGTWGCSITMTGGWYPAYRIFTGYIRLYNDLALYPATAYVTIFRY